MGFQPRATVAVTLAMLAGAACRPPRGAEPAAKVPTTTTDGVADLGALDDAEGGQLFDKWLAADSFSGEFTADDKNTPTADGAGGPGGNGTLRDGRGQAMLNTGHDYRMKNLFGWDLRGAEGIYGGKYQNKPYVLPVNLLADQRSTEDLAAWLAKGDEQVPAYGDVLSDAQLSAVAAFIVGVRERRLPHPEQIWSLAGDAPKHYRLVDGGDAAAGAKAIAEQCAGCHGEDGTEIVIDENYSLGAFARANAYEAWLKVLNGQPGSPMGRQTTDAKVILDVLAALCDRKMFPAKDAEHDVADGDARCGAYLK